MYKLSFSLRGFCKDNLKINDHKVKSEIEMHFHLSFTLGRLLSQLFLKLFFSLQNRCNKNGDLFFSSSIYGEKTHNFCYAITHFLSLPSNSVLCHQASHYYSLMKCCIRHFESHSTSAIHSAIC